MTEIKNMWMEINNSLIESGFRYKTVSANHIDELRFEIENLFANKLVGSDLYQEELNGFEFSVAKSMPDASTIIIATAPSPAVKAMFRYNSNDYTVVIPPTYVHDTDDTIFAAINNVLAINGYKLKRAKLPEKLLTVRSGLGTYGKNNIVFVEGMGSFHRPVAFFTNAPQAEDNWGIPHMHEQCKNCKGCIKTCPTKAISGNRFLIDAEKCITFHNERNLPFPDWLKPEWHNSLIGCMICQDNCPINKAHRSDGEVAADFTQQETEVILQNSSPDNLKRDTYIKLEKIAMIREYRHLARNLSALIEN
jgi:epoxyqueuosine reductase